MQNKSASSEPYSSNLCCSEVNCITKICDRTCFQVSAVEIYIVYSFSALVSFQVFTHQSNSDSLLKRRKHSKVQVLLLFYYMWKTIIFLWLFCFLGTSLHFVPKPSRVIPLALHFYILDPSWLPATTSVFSLPSSISA